MARDTNKKYRGRLKFLLVYGISSSLLIANYALPIKALESLQQSEHFIIAKLAPERLPEEVKTGIEQSPTPEVSRPQNVTQERIEVPHLPGPVASDSDSNASRSSPRNTDDEEAPRTRTASTQRRYRNTDDEEAPRTRTASTQRRYRNTDDEEAPRTRTASTQRRYRNTDNEEAPRTRTASTQRRYRNTDNEQAPRTRTASTQRSNDDTSRRGTNQPIGDLQLASKTPTYRQINFVDFALGVLAAGDFKSQGRYFHFYQFEGRENQRIQIRLIGSADQRRSNNLSLNPYMFLLDPNKKVLLTKGSTATTNLGSKEQFIFARLPVKGTYTIAVTSRKPASIGRYNLAIRNDNSSYTLDESNDISSNSQILRKNGSPYDVSAFKGKKNQLVSIRADSIFEEFSPYVVLLNSQGKIIGADNNKHGGYTGLIDRVKLPEDGTYYAVVISAIPRERGTYRLTIF